MNEEDPRSRGDRSLGYAVGNNEPAGVPEYFPDRRRDLYAPIALFVFGCMVGVYVLAPINKTAKELLSVIGSYFVVLASIMLVTMPLLVQVMRLSLGTVPSALIKLSAIGTLPIALAAVQIKWLGCVGILTLWLTSLPLSIFLFRWLFDMEWVEGALCTVVVWGVSVGLWWVWIWIFGFALGIS